MKVTVTLPLPAEVEQQLSHDLPRLSAEARESLAVQLFRRGAISHYQLSEALGIDRIETDAVLKRYNVEEYSLSLGDFDADRDTLRRVLGRDK